MQDATQGSAARRMVETSISKSSLFKSTSRIS